MSWSLQIINGDLSFNGASMNIVQGGEKLVQDLACCVLEPMGTDDMHPTFGSTIGGGINPDGTYNPGVIGGPNDNAAGTFVNGEITRIAVQYQAQQSARFAGDVATYGKGTITADEALLSLGSVNSTANQNVMIVQADLETGTGSTAISLLINSVG
jgi:hypothetical protein